MTVSHQPRRNVIWILTEYGSGPEQRRSINIPTNKSIVGRTDEADVTLAVSSISKRHAKLWFENEELWVQDLGSTNGTLVNGTRIERSRLGEGDLVQFANAVYRVGTKEESHCDVTIEEGLIPWTQTLLTFDRLLSERSVIPHFQPIVTIDRQSIDGYEALARSDLPELQNPAKMFDVAERLGQNAALSELMREEAAEDYVAVNPNAELFLNTHPEEFGTQRLRESLEKLSRNFPSIRFTIEIHECAVTQLNEMRELRSILHSLGMKLSYDDFGSGQGRLLELVEVPPDVLKFDMQLIRDIDTASGNRVDLLRSLLKIAKDAGTKTLAEGVESKSEHQVCSELGFDLGQGFFYGKPGVH